MKLVPSLLVLAIAVGVAPDAGAEQKARFDPWPPVDYQLNACREVPTAGGAITAMNLVSPTASLVGAVLTQEHRQVSPQEGSALEATVKLIQLQGAAHGQLIPHSADGTPSGRVVYEYRSEPGYLGKDQAIFLAEFEGKRYKIVVNVIVSEGIDENNPQCPPPPGQLIKITNPSSGFNGYDPNSVTVTFADLPRLRGQVLSLASPS